MMDHEVLSRLGLARFPFGTGAGGGAFYAGPQHREAVSFLERALQSVDLLVVLTGERGAGKQTTLDFTLGQALPGALVASLGALPTAPDDFFAALLAGFGFDGLNASRDEMRGLIEVFLGQQLQKNTTTVIVANVPSTVSGGVIKELGWLSLLNSTRHGRLKLVLLGGEGVERQLAAPRMHALRQMIRWQHRLEALGLAETRDYLEFHAEAAGSDRPEKLFSPEASARIHELSGGLPGRIDQVAARALHIALEANEDAVGGHCVKQPEESEVGEDAPPPRRVAALDILLDGQPTARISLNASRLLIGRHPWNDVRLDHDSVSRHHAMLVREGGRWTVVDLNSTNGIRVNDHVVRQRRLNHGDVVQVGQFRLVLGEGIAPMRSLESVEEDVSATTILPG